MIYVRENCTLRANGENAAQGGPGGGAGILCPSGSTLVVTGPGAVRAVGGNASDGRSAGPSSIKTKNTKVHKESAQPALIVVQWFHVDNRK